MESGNAAYPHLMKYLFYDVLKKEYYVIHLIAKRNRVADPYEAWQPT